MEAATHTPYGSGHRKGRSGLKTYARAVGPLARAIQPHRTRAKCPLHMQSPAVPAMATGTLARTPPT
eukprot:5428699-Alexandrium_andersonii.AAC.1